MCLASQYMFFSVLCMIGTVSRQIYSGGVKRWSLPFLLVSQMLCVDFVWKSCSMWRARIHLNYLVDWRIRGCSKPRYCAPFPHCWKAFSSLSLLLLNPLVEKGRSFMHSFMKYRNIQYEKG